ncbi:MAG: hypothetical protein MJ103_01460 [Saccharofermentans sp.]|nr:hypothetical protein [Saccharofermentans sp.]
MADNELTKEEIVAMAVAAIAEETGTDCKNIRVKSFRELSLTGLAKYIADNNITYKKYTLEDEL